MMDKNMDRLLYALEDEIDRKCFEIRQKRKGTMLQRLFIAACALFIAVPIFLVFAGVHLWTFCIPAALFFVVSFAVLSPLLFSVNPGGLE